MKAKFKKFVCFFMVAIVVMMSTSATDVIADTGKSIDNTAETSQENSSSNNAADSKTEMENGKMVMDSAVGKKDESQWITLSDYKKIAESNSYIMYFYEPRLSVILKDKETGALLESTLSDENDDGDSNESWNAYMKSGIVISLIIGTTNTYQVDLITCKNTIDVTYTDNGFSAEVYFTDYKFGLTLNVELENDELVAEIPDDSIKEDKEGTYISTISIYPFMGYTYMDAQNGYMLIPDGNGALIYLNNKEGRYTTGFSQMIYGSDCGFTDSGTDTLLWDKFETVVDANQVIAPIFGMIHSDDQLGYIAVVESGDKRANIEAQPNGVMVNYNRCFAKFLLRDIYVQPLNNSNSGTVIKVESDRVHADLRVRYILADKEDANYSGLAVKYQKYLLDNNLIVKKDTSYNTRVDFLGTDREEWMLFTKAVTMTTTENIEEIYGDLQDQGIKSLLSVYKGWQKGGLYNVPISKYKADNNIGGTSALTDLIKTAGEQDYQLYLYNDALRTNPDESNSTFNVIKKINKRTFKEKTYDQVYDEFLYLTPERTSYLLNNFIDSYTKNGIQNLAILGISDTLFSYSYKSKYYSRYDCAQNYLNSISDIDKNTNLALEQPFEYLWNNTDIFLDMPLGSSDYMYIDEEVPFLSMVLKGIIPMYSDYVNFEANKTEFFLQMIEAGVYPSFYITYENSSALIYTNSSDLYSTEYSTYRDTIIEYDEKFREVAEKTDGACIINHQKLNNGITVVTYDNGVSVYVNYTDKDVSINGYIVEAMSYKVGETK